jgi:hypothetical protein
LGDVVGVVPRHGRRSVDRLGEHRRSAAPSREDRVPLFHGNIMPAMLGLVSMIVRTATLILLIAAQTFAAQKQECAMLGNVIHAVYHQILGRYANPEEFSRATREVGGGQPVSSLVRSVALSDEHLGSLKSLPPSAQAESLHRHILGRPAGDDEATAIAAIQKGGLREAAEALLKSSEYRARFGTGAVPSPPDSKAKALCR